MIREFMGLSPYSKLIPYHSSWNELIPILKIIGDILFDENTLDSDRNLIESSFDDLDYWIMKGDITKTYKAIIKFIIIYSGGEHYAEEEN